MNIYNNDFKYKNEKIEKLINKNIIIEDNQEKNKINKINIKEKKIENIQPLLKEEINETIPNNEIKGTKEYELDDLEFINNHCNHCNIKNYEFIYKCVICKNYFLCDKCFTKNETKFHEHKSFFKINFPNSLKNLIKIKEENEKIIDKFNIIIKDYFFDFQGNLSTENKNDFDEDKLKQTCIEMESIDMSPSVYFSEYKKTFINFNLNKLCQEKRQLIIDKMSIFIDIISKY